jgi:TolA-binding protein
MRLALVGCVALLPLLTALPARAQLDTRDGIALQNQILELRQEVQTLRNSIGNGSSVLGGQAPAYTPPSSANDMTATLLDRVSRLEDEVRTLRGKVDELDNALQQQNADLTKQIGDLGFRMDAAHIPGGSSVGAPPTAGAAPSSYAPPAYAAPSGAPASGAPGYPPSMSPPPGSLGAIPATPTATLPPLGGRRTPERAMQEGNAALARRDYATAEAAAREVLANPRGPRAIDAQFLLAEALAGKRDYGNAAVAFDDAYSRARTGPHAQDALLGLANSLIALGDKQAACASLDKMRVAFPVPRADLRAPVAAARARAACR